MFQAAGASFPDHAPPLSTSCRGNCTAVSDNEYNIKC
ncbi:hypothetical protein Nmel_010811 [Mimus melanotis]